MDTEADLTLANKVQNFECHVTLAPEHGTEIVTKMAERLRFKTSFLVGDDMLGAGKHFYCTSHDYTFARMQGRMEELIKYLADHGVPIKRKKIEHILLDERF